MIGVTGGVWDWAYKEMRWSIISDDNLTTAIERQGICAKESSSNDCYQLTALYLFTGAAAGTTYTFSSSITNLNETVYAAIMGLVI